MRYFLVDKVTRLTPGERACGIKNVTLSDEILHDHFPDHPIFPGTQILEAAAQLAGFLLESTFNKAGEPPLRAVMVQIQQAKFYEPCGPGDRLDIEVELASRLESAAQVRADVRVGDRRAARAEMTFVMRRIESERVHEQRRALYRMWTRGIEPPPPIF
jgi:3-hydroxyacyl-[acyl-carrier-protein] dehydratase